MDNKDGILEDQSKSVAAANLKSLGDAPAFYNNLAYGNAIAHQQSIQQLQLALTAKAAEMILATSPVEGGVDLAALQQIVKTAQTTPPETAEGRHHK